MGRRQGGVQIARLFYAIAAVIALIVAAGVVATAVLGTTGCQVVLSFGAPGTSGSSGGNPAPASPVPAVPGGPSGCVQYVDVVPALLAVVLGVILLVTVTRLGRESETWGLTIAVGAIAGIVASLVAAYAVVGISTSDQPRSSLGLGSILIAALPLIGALGSTFVVWRAHARRADVAQR